VPAARLKNGRPRGSLTGLPAEFQGLPVVDHAAKTTPDFCPNTAKSCREAVACPAVLYTPISTKEVLLLALFVQSSQSYGRAPLVWVIILIVATIACFVMYFSVFGFSSPAAVRSAARRGRYWHLDPRATIGGLVGGLVGAVVGYLLGTSPLLSFGDVLQRGANLQGIGALMRPAAEAASNWMIAGAIVGAVGGLILAYLTSSRSSAAPAETLPGCPNCGAPISSWMEFCGKCGRSLALTTCRKCGKPVPPNQEFCGACGTRVT
jgi:hypothetical protein